MTFKNPPLTEALIDVRVNLDPEFDINLLEKFHEKIKEEYPVKQINTSWETKFEIKPGEAPSVNSKDNHNGFIFKTSNNEKLVQTRKDGFTYNVLNGYEDWETFVSEAKKLWGFYLEIAKPVNITRLALRYINVIKLPRPTGDLKEYFTTVPEISSELPQMMTEFFMRVVIPDVSTPNSAIVIETVDLSKIDDKSIPVVFDIDTFRLVDVKGDAPAIWEIFESLKTYRSTVFWKSLTKKTTSLFE